MLDARGWNKCAICGRFRKADTLVEMEHRELGIGGELRETWWFECDDCRAVPTSEQPGQSDA